MDKETVFKIIFVIGAFVIMFLFFKAQFDEGTAVYVQCKQLGYDDYDIIEPTGERVCVKVDRNGFVNKSPPIRPVSG